MTVAAAELRTNGNELTNEQLLLKLREFHQTQPPLDFYKENFFEVLEHTDITHLIGEATNRFASSEISDNPHNRFSVTMTPINASLLRNGRGNEGLPEIESKILKMEYLPDPKAADRPSLRIILPVDSDMHFDRGRQTRITYIDKWRRLYTHVMQAGVESNGSGQGPRHSFNALRNTVSLLVETIEMIENSRQKKMGRAAKWLGEAVQWQVNLAWSSEPLSVSQALKRTDKLSASC